MIMLSIATALISPVRGSINVVNAFIITEGTANFPHAFLMRSRNVHTTGPLAIS